MANKAAYYILNLLAIFARDEDTARQERFRAVTSAYYRGALQ